MTQLANQSLDAAVPRARRRGLGYASYVVGCLCAAVTGVMLTALFPPDGQFIVILLITLGLLTLSIVLMAMAEGFLVPSARDVCIQDPRSPVLFLRPFDEDKELTYDVISTGETTTTITAKAEDFLYALNAVGPLISLGKPTWSSGLGIHPHGAFRDYVDGSQWQQRIEQLLDQAGMVVLAVGDSPGIEWEITQVRKRIGPESLILYLSPRPTDALTRKGRARKEQTIYEHFKPMVERHFAIDLPPFSEALYIIGFDATGTPVMAPDLVRSRWAMSEHSRVAGAITSQLKAVLAKVRPGIDLNHYRVPGRPAIWWRVSLAVLIFLAALGFGFGASATGLSHSLFAQGWALLLQTTPDMALIAGWVMLARHFARRWVWWIPGLLGLLALLKLGTTGAWLFGYPFDQMSNNMVGYSWINSLLYTAYAVSVLVLGLVVSRHAKPPPGDKAAR